jgi:small GTP-binding protein
MSSITEQIERIEKEIRDTPYHKATEHHIGRLRAKLSKLKDEEISAGTKKGGGVGYSVKKQGDATIVLVGSPSVGKSTLLNKLTNAKSKIAPYAFTTVKVIPGMMEYKDAKIQILDVPGLIEGAEAGKGRGKEVISVIRNSDLLIILCDVAQVGSFESISNSLEKAGIRLNRTPPNVAIEKKLKGGIKIVSNFKQSISSETIQQIAKEFRIPNADITIKEKLTMESLIDAFTKSRVYIPVIYVVNKIDLKSKTKSKVNFKSLSISAEKGTNLEKLKEEIWNQLKFVRVYLVRRDDKPGKDHPIIMKVEDKLSDVARKIGEDFAEDKTRAKIWGTGAKFSGQEVSLSTKVAEGMQVRFV